MSPNFYVILSYLSLGGLIVLMPLAGYLWARLRTSEKQRKAISAQLSELEGKVGYLHLEMLEARLSPHLFKNILNSIQSHAYQTYFALDKLANVLDYILYESKNRFVTPKEEIAFALDLIEINKIKLSPLFELKIKKSVNELDELYNQPLLAPLVSVDLIENAFKHADLQSLDAFISVVFGFKENIFYLTVSNKKSPKPPIKKANSGIGSETLEKRLRIIYKNHFRLERFTEEDVYIAHLTIDLLGYKAEMSATGR